MFAFFRPAAHQAPLPAEKIDSTYRRLRWQIFAGIFFGYAGYYLLRKNFSLAMPYLIDEGYTPPRSIRRPPIGGALAERLHAATRPVRDVCEADRLFPLPINRETFYPDVSLAPIEGDLTIAEIWC